MQRLINLQGANNTINVSLNPGTRPHRTPNLLTTKTSNLEAIKEGIKETIKEVTRADVSCVEFRATVQRDVRSLVVETAHTCRQPILPGNRVHTWRSLLHLKLLGSWTVVPLIT